MLSLIQRVTYRLSGTDVVTHWVFCQKPKDESCRRSLSQQPNRFPLPVIWLRTLPVICVSWPWRQSRVSSFWCSRNCR
ncbi:hypothetical protein EMIT0215P_30348 [Pseudomonas serboccidentalis]